MAQTPERKREFMKGYYLRNKEKLDAERREHYQRNREQNLLNQKQRRRDNPAKYLFHQAKRRAAAKELVFDIKLEDVIVPEKCPILHLPLSVGENGRHEGSPTLDRIDNKKGYVKDNIHVISWRANRIKNDSSLEELKLIVNYLSNILRRQSFG